MDENNWRPQGGETTMETGDWRATLQPDSRQRIVNKIMETLKKHLPVTVNEGLNELKKIAERFEEKIYTAATSQRDYLRKISLKMLTMENKSQSTVSNSPSNSASNSSKPPDTGLVVRSQSHNQGQSTPIPLASQPQSHQQLLTENVQNNISSATFQSSTGWQSVLPPVSGISQTPMTNVGQNSTMQTISGAPQHSIGTSMGQGVPPNMFSNSQRQMQGRQQVISQQQQQAQNTQQYIFHQQQIHHQLMNQNLHLGNMQQPLMHSPIQQHQQQQQQGLLQPNQLQSSQQSVMQTSSVMQPSISQSSSLSNLQSHQQSNNIQHSTQATLQQHPQANMRQQQQTTAVHQQQMPMSQQPLLSQQQLMNQQSSATNIQQNQFHGQQNNVSGIQHRQQGLLGHQNNVSNFQQQLVNQQSSIPNIHRQQVGGNMYGLQQQRQLLLPQSANSNIPSNQQSLHMLQHSKPLPQQSQPNASNLMPSQGQQSQPQPRQQQLLPQIQSQPAQSQQQLGLQQQQANAVQRDMQQRFQQPTPLLQQQNALDQKQPYQSQRALPETSSNSLDSTAETGLSNGLDWRDEVMQKIKTMRELYMPDLNDLFQRIASKVHQCDSLPQAAKTDNVEKLRQFKQMLEHILAFLTVNKNAIVPAMKDKLAGCEKQIVNIIGTHRPKRPMQQGQLSPHHMQMMPQAQSQGNQVQPCENQMSQLQSSVTTVQQNSMNSLQQTMPSSSCMKNSIQPVPNLDLGQANTMSSLQQVTAGPLQQSPVSAPQQTNLNTMTSQLGVNMLQSNLNNIRPYSNLTQQQQQHLKHQHDQILQNQQLKQQIQQRHFQEQLMQRQQMLQQQQQQQLHQPVNQQLPVQMQTHQQPQVHQINDINELKVRQAVSVKSGVFQPHLSAGLRSAYPHQQFKPGPQFHASSPQLLQADSPQILQHSSPQVDQQSLPPSIPKIGTPLQSANSPFVGPTPSPPLAPSPAPAAPCESEKPISSVSSLTNAGSVGQQTSGLTVTSQSLAIGTPGISASPLLAECAVNDSAYGNALAAASGKPTVTEQPIERLIKAVKSLSPEALGDCVSDMSSVVTMMDRIAGAAPGNGSRAAVGEDLVAMTKWRLQARNFITQDGSTGTKNMRRYTRAMPFNVMSSACSITDSLKQVAGSEISELESTATSSVKRPRTEANHALTEEIRAINRRLITTEVDMSDDDVDQTGTTEVMEGTVVKCSFTAVVLCPSLKSQYSSAQMSLIQPLRLLVPTDYPHCSPILLDKFPAEFSRETDDLSEKVKSKFCIMLRSLSQPMSLKDIARTWDVCARAVTLEHAQRSGGGSFSSKYGTWEKCFSAVS